MAEHLGDIKVERLHAIFLYKREMCIACRLAYDIHWCSLALCYLPHLFDILLVNEQSHPLLALIGYYLLG